MPDWLNHKGIEVPDATPSGEAGLKLKDDLIELADRAPYQTGADPDANDDDTAGFAAGSRWLNTSTAVMWVCVDPSTASAVWRTLYHRDDAALVLCPDDGSGERGLQIDSDGDARGTDAVDLQTIRANSTEVASGTRSFIAGGADNTADGDYSHASGQGNVANGEASRAEGAYANATLFGQTAQAGGKFSAVGDAQHGRYVLRNQTTNATQTELFLNGSSERLVLSNDTTWAFSILIVARRTDANDESAGYKVEGVIDRNATAGSTAIVGSVTKTVLAEDSSAWDVAVDADTTNGSLRIQVTGEASKTIRWVAVVQTAETVG